MGYTTPRSPRSADATASSPIGRFWLGRRLTSRSAPSWPHLLLHFPVPCGQVPVGMSFALLWFCPCCCWSAAYVGVIRAPPCCWRGCLSGWRARASLLLPTGYLALLCFSPSPCSLWWRFCLLEVISLSSYRVRVSFQVLPHTCCSGPVSLFVSPTLPRWTDCWLASSLRILSGWGSL